MCRCGYTWPPNQHQIGYRVGGLYHTPQKQAPMPQTRGSTIAWTGKPGYNRFGGWSSTTHVSVCHILHIYIYIHTYVFLYRFISTYNVACGDSVATVWGIRAMVQMQCKKKRAPHSELDSGKDNVVIDTSLVLHIKHRLRIAHNISNS